MKLAHADPQRCIGCGKSGVFLCDACREIHAKTVERVIKLWSTLYLKFSTRIF
jgi:hypothetical protein